jgi:uncharacterized OB-fold protein
MASPPPPLCTALSVPWWNALARGEVVIQQCVACLRPIHYPRAFCPHCSARDPEWVLVSGEGTLYTFTVARAPLGPDFVGLERQVLCVVDLDGPGDTEPVRVVSTLVGLVEDEIRIGMRLRPVFDGSSFAGLTVLRFTAV